MFQSHQILQERYQLQQQLGRTAAGHQIWLAIDLLSKEQVTVKLLALSPTMEWEELKLFEREAQVLQALEHSRIPHYRDYFDIDKQTGKGISWFALVQDYIPGSSLQELLERGQRFTEKQVRDIALEVLDILIYLHELSPPVLHRDIKPSNLILGEDENIYLIDFGAVQATAAVTGVTFTVVGTSGYAPLEQFWGRAVAASDLYALGATLIHLLTGIAPADLPQQNARIQFRDRLNLQSDFIPWIEKMTEMALEKRFPNGRIARSALESKQFSPHLSPEVPVVGKLAKPNQTRIKIDKSPENLEIYIPPGLKELSLFSIILGCSTVLAIYSIVAIIIEYMVTEPIRVLVLLLFLLPLAVPGIMFFFGGTYIYFHRVRFEIMRKFFFLTDTREKCKIESIVGVFFHKKGQKKYVTIHSQEKVYFLGDAFTEDEAAWLAQEIQDWLQYR